MKCSIPVTLIVMRLCVLPELTVKGTVSGQAAAGIPLLKKTPV